MKWIEKDKHHHEVNLILLYMFLLRPNFIDDLELHECDQKVNDVKEHKDSTLVTIVENLEQVIDYFDDQDALVNRIWIRVVIGAILAVMVYSLFNIW